MVHRLDLVSITKEQMKNAKKQRRTAKLPIYLCAEIFRSQKAIPQEAEDVIRLSQIMRYIGRVSYRVSELSGKTGE
jgi:hypothetical protein